MTSVGSVTNSAADMDAAGKLSQALSSQDFLNIMITELTHQDPLDPMKNQDLLNQMSIIQQLDSSQAMTKSFNQLMGNFDSMLLRQQLSAASGMVDTLVSGVTNDGLNAFGKVVGIRIDNNHVIVQLDTGESISMENITTMGGRSGENIVGTVVMGPSADGSHFVVGQVESVVVGQNSANLVLATKPGQEQADEIPLSNATMLTQENVGLLIGTSVEAIDAEGIAVSGIVNSYNLSHDENGNNLVTIRIMNQSTNQISEVPLTSLIEIKENT